jgi:hypothetical protein
MIRNSEKQIQDVIARGYPRKMVYRNAKPIRRGRTRYKRRVGQSPDKHLYLEFLMRHGKIKEVLFMVVVGHSAGMIAVERVIQALKPDWHHFPWLNMETGKKDGVEVKIDKINDDMLVRFVRIV